MGYYLQGFIGTKNDLQNLLVQYSAAKLVQLGQGLSIIPMTEELVDQISAGKVSQGIGSFEYLTDSIEAEVLLRIEDKQVAYIEAEYFGGEGGQIGIIWKAGKRDQYFDYGEEVINKVLRNFGVVANPGEDEFDTLNFGRHRNTRKWIDCSE